MFDINGMTKRLDNLEEHMVRLVTAVERLVVLQEVMLDTMQVDRPD